MKYYLTQSYDIDNNSLELFDSSLEEFSSVSMDDLGSMLDEDSTLIHLVPCSKYSTYKYEYDKTLNNTVNEINFISNVEDFVVESISSQTIFFHNDEGYIIEQNFINHLNKNFSNLRVNTIIIPEHIAIKSFSNDALINFDEEIFFFNEDLPYRFATINLESNSDIKNSIDYKKLIDYKNFYNNKFKSHIADNIANYPNFFSFNFSFSSLKSNLRISNFYLVTLILSVSLFLLLPIIQTNIYKKDIETFETGINSIFLSLDKNATEIINPKRQIDLIADNFDLLQKNKITLPNINFIEKFGIEYIDSIEIDISNNNAKIQISDIPASQLNIFLTMSNTLDVRIINQEIDTIDNLSSGFIIIGI